MRAILTILMTLSLPALAKDLTYRQKELFQLRAQAVGRTLQEKNLPAKFVKAQAAKTRSPEDRALVTKALKSWSQYYSKDVTYAVTRGVTSILYKGVALIYFETAGNDPLTVLINGKTKVNLKTKSPLQALMGAVKQAGYKFSGRNSSAWLPSLLPAAEAQLPETSEPRTFENSIILASSAQYLDGRVAQITVEPEEYSFPAKAVTMDFAEEGLLFPEWWNTGWSSAGGIAANFNQTDMKCHGSFVSGKMQDRTGRVIEFTADRNSGVTLKFDGLTVTGLTPNVENSACKQYDKFEKSRNEFLYQNPGATESDMAVYPQQRMDGIVFEMGRICRTVKGLRPAIDLNCNARFTDAAARSAFCSRMAEIIVYAPTEFKVCRETQCQQDLLSATSSPGGVAKADEFMRKYSAEMKAGTIGGGFQSLRVSDPSKFSGMQSKKVLDDIDQVNAAMGDKPWLGDFADAAMGFLDGCGDTQFKRALMDRKINIIPDDGTTDAIK